MSDRRRHRPTILIVVLVAVLAVVAGCGIPQDSSPRALGPVLATPTPEPTPEPDATQDFAIYLVAPNRLLSPVTREVPDPLTLPALLDQLTVPATDEERALGLGTSIPAGTVLSTLPVLRNNGVAVIDLEAGSSDALVGAQLQEALAQLVYTFTESGSVDAVVILIEGQRLPWPTSQGESTEPLTRDDYATFAPDFVPDPTATPMTPEGTDDGA